MLNLALLDQLLHGSRHVFNGNLGVYAVLIEQIDGIDFEPLERAFDDLLNVLWPAIQATPSRFAVESRFVTKLGRYYYLPAEGQERVAHEFFICVRAITSAVSKNVTPRSTAAWRREIISFLSGSGW